MPPGSNILNNYFSGIDIYKNESLYFTSIVNLVLIVRTICLAILIQRNQIQ
jgi:hypothetical protein